MAAKRIAILVVLCYVLIVKCENGINKVTEIVRIKRSKYYTGSPLRIYRKPPPPYAMKGVFSHTPPPNYMYQDDTPFPGVGKPAKFSGPYDNNGLSEDDINNLMKHLSKQDLDKIVEFAGERYKDSSSVKYTDNRHNINEDNDPYKTTDGELSSHNSYKNGPYAMSWHFRNKDKPLIDGGTDHKKHVIREYDSNKDHRGPYVPEFSIDKPIYVQETPNSSKTFSSTHQAASVHDKDSMEINQFSFLDSFIEQELYSNPSQKPNESVKVEPEEMDEVKLPKPDNLREEQNYVASNTNHVPAIVSAESYKIESFGDLPLMDYHSKLHTVSSYHVPHYSVVSPDYRSPITSPSQLTPSPSASRIKVPSIEPAPPPSLAKEQSDAHLKAVKIWTHRSRGTAYTLHDDGTLSLEKPVRPKLVYGPS